MTTFTNVPKQVEEELEKSAVTPSRRNFLKSAGLLVVSFSAAGTDPLIPRSKRPSSRGCPGCGPVSRPRLPATRFVDRHS